jgi:LPXTG-motif cell wall-anchored protein
LSHVRWISRLLVTFGAASACVLLVAGTASAAVVVPLHDAHRDTTAAGFENHSCAQIPGDAAVPGKDGWIFVLPANDADFVSLILQFRTAAGTTTTVTIPNAADQYPDGITSNGTSKAWVLLPAGWTLLDGSAVVSGETKAAFFNLTHTCPGTPSASPSPSVPPSASQSASASASPSDNASPSGSRSPSGSVSPSTEATPSASATTAPAGGSLPKTGAPIGTMVLAGATTFSAGAALLLLSFWRRRIGARSGEGTIRLNNSTS